MKILRAEFLPEPDYVQNRLDSATVLLEDHDAVFLLHALEDALKYGPACSDPNYHRLKNILEALV
jgi:hypothetical protein